MERTSRQHLKYVEELTASSLRELESHAGLWLDTYIHHPGQDEEAIIKRKQLLQEVCALPVSAAYRAYYQRWKKQLNEYGATFEVTFKKARARGRVSIGLGTESVLETGITLHRTYGVPYIPGSALKGLAAAYAYQRLQGEWEKGNEWYNIVFGKTEEAGFITFFDALLIPGEQDIPFLHQDSITVHHPDYYRTGQSAPADWDSPTPISFLSATGTYLLALAAPDLEEKKIWLEAVWQILELALAQVGIGVKTSSGYGRMEVYPGGFAPKEGKGQGEEIVQVVDPEEIAMNNTLKEIQMLNSSSLAGQSQNIYNRWKKLQAEARRRQVAQAMIEKIQKCGKTGDLSGKSWYREMQDSLRKEKYNNEQ